jgi:iron complex transport system ATP-binding protein
MNLLEAYGLEVSIRGVPIIRGIDLALPQGEVLGLIGANGSGKSTLLRALAAHWAYDAGRVLLLGKPLRDWSPEDRARRLAYLPQRREIHARLRVSEVVGLGRIPYAVPFSREAWADHAAVERAMEVTGVSSIRDSVATELSGGEQVRVLLARALSTEAPVLLADEPTAGLDPHFQIQVMRVLRARATGGTGILVTLHDLALASRFCDRLVLLDRGECVAEGVPRDVLSSVNLARAYRIEARSFSADGVEVLVPWREVVSR